MKSLFLTALLFFSSTAALKADVPALPAPEAFVISRTTAATHLSSIADFSYADAM